MVNQNESPTQMGEILERFVVELEQGKNPDIESYLALIPVSLRDRYLMDLVELQVHFRLQSGDESIAPSDYLKFGHSAVDYARRQIVSQHPDYDSVLAEKRTRSLAFDSKQKTIKHNTSYSQGSIIDRFTLQELIGEGGMGSVWVARQDEPVHRQVALKLIKGLTTDSSVIARFEAERQALATMNHPNIAKILDGGATESGDPYFVMDLIEGDPITDYCDQHQLSVQQRLNLFLPICKAIEHAHQKGIVHRDLKPSNVLIATEDGQPVPKIIDFGLAKAVGRTNNLISGNSIDTGTIGFLGTVHYMSPEQAGPDATNVDARTDVYSMGVMLYELLTGSTPLNNDNANKETLLSALETIRDVAPQSPSSRLSSSGKAVADVCRNRCISPAKLQNELKSELDWIVMRALEKDVEQRYQTATGLSDDVQRYLVDEAVLARPSTTGYRAGKFVRRNRGLVASLATIAMLLVAGISGATWFALGERTQRKLAASEATRANKLAEQANQSAKQSKDALEVFTSSFLSVDPTHGANANMLARDVLFRARDNIDASELDDEGKAEMLHSLAKSFFGTGEYEAGISAAQSAIDFYESELGAYDAVTLSAKNELAKCYVGRDELRQAIPLLKSISETGVQQLGPEHPVAMTSLNLLATSYNKNDQPALAIPLLEKVLKQRLGVLGPVHHDTLAAKVALANSYLKDDQTDLAISLLEQAAEICKQEFGADHPSTLGALENLARGHRRLGKYRGSVEKLEVIYELKRIKMGEEHPETLISMSNLAQSLGQAGRHQESLELAETVVELRKKVLGSDHPAVLKSMNNLAYSYFKVGRRDSAVKMFEEMVGIATAQNGADHNSTLSIMGNLASCYNQTGRFEKAIELNQKILEIRTSKSGPKHRKTLLIMNNLATDYVRAGQIEEGSKLLEKTLELRKNAIGADHPHTLGTMRSLAVSYNKLDRKPEAQELLEKALRGYKSKLGDDHPETFAVTQQLGSLLIETDAVRAEQLIEQVFQHYKSSKPEDWLAYESQTLLGGAILNQDRADEAAIHLEEGYLGLKANVEKIPGGIRKPMLVDAVNRLIKLAEATKDDTALTKWRDELGSYE